MDRETSIAHRRGERSPLADRLARRSELPDALPDRTPRPLRMRPRESAAVVVVVVAALVTALATSGAGWGIPLRAAVDETATEAAQPDVPSTEPPAPTPAEPPTSAPTEPATATTEPEPTATETPAETPTPTPAESSPTSIPTEPTEPTEEPQAPTVVPTAPDEQPNPATPDSTPPLDEGGTPESTPNDTETPDPTVPTDPTATPATATEAPTESSGNPIVTPTAEVPADGTTPTPQPTETTDLATPVATPVASPVVTPDPSATPDEQDGPTVPLLLALSPGDVSTADPGTVVELIHHLTIVDPPTEQTRLALRLTTSRDWPASLSLAGQSLPLWDSNGDGVIELTIEPGQTASTLAVRMEVPAGALAGERASVALAVWQSNGSPEAAVTATDEIVANRVLTVRVEPDTTPFGRVAPDGSLDPRVEGVSSIVDAEGAWYYMERAVVVSVTTNAPIEMTCQSEAIDGAVDGRLAWRLTGTTTWTTFGAIGAAPGAVCLPALEPGVHLFVFDVRLRVNWTDPPGAIAAEVNLTPLEPPAAGRPDEPPSA